MDELYQVWSDLTTMGEITESWSEFCKYIAEKEQSFCRTEIKEENYRAGGRLNKTRIGVEL